MTTGDGLPRTICQKCVEQLKTFYTFKKQCEEVDKSFREVISSRNGRVKQEIQQQPTESEQNIIDEINSLMNEANSTHVKDEDELEPGLIRDVHDKCDYIEFLENNQQILTCRVCYKVFTTVEGLRCHKRLHTGGMFKCKICDKEYTRQNHLQRHESTHGKRKVHVCKICNKTLTRFEHLKRHLTIHLKEKPFVCNICNRGFNRQEHLANHMKRCKGDRIYICDICNKGFNREDSLEVHRRLHENKVPVLPTLENLDNIDEHYYQIDYDGNMPFSDASDNEVEDCFEPQINIDVADAEEQQESAEVQEEAEKTESSKSNESENVQSKADENVDVKGNFEIEEHHVDDNDDDGGDNDVGHDGK